jgi:hypothetical protein
VLDGARPQPARSGQDRRTGKILRNLHPAFRAQRLFVGSGVVKAGCKTVAAATETVAASRFSHHLSAPAVTFCVQGLMRCGLPSDYHLVRTCATSRQTVVRNWG